MLYMAGVHKSNKQIMIHTENFKTKKYYETENGESRV